VSSTPLRGYLQGTIGQTVDAPVSDRRPAARLRRHGQALAELKRSHAELAQRVAALETKVNRSIAGLLERIDRYERTLRDGRTTMVRQQRELRTLASTARIQQVTSAVNSAQTAAYGERGSVLVTNNLLLAGNQLFWVFLDPVLRSFGVPLGPSPSVLSWLAPLGSLATGGAVLGNRQHARFISGISTFNGTTFVVQESLQDRMAASLWPEFQRRTDVPVTTAILDPFSEPITAAASVRNGVLRIEIVPVGVTAFPLVIGSPLSPPGAPKGRIAWMVDTGVDAG
jgi:hypothetical protein